MPKKKLKNLLIDRVDLVGKGDNPEAHITLFKNSDNPEGGESIEEIVKRFEKRLEEALSKTKGVEEMFDIKKFKEELPEDQRKGLEKYLETLESAEIKKLNKQLEEKDSAIADMTETVAELKKAAEENDSNGTTEDVIKELPEDVRKMVEDSVAKAKAAEERIQKLEDDSLNKEYIEKASVFEALPVNAQDIGPVFKRVAQVSKEDYDKLEALLKAADEQLVQNNILLKEVGAGGANSVEQPAWEKVEAAAKELVAADSTMTQEQAIAKVLQDNPDLYAEYQKESMEVQ